MDRLFIEELKTLFYDIETIISISKMNSETKIKRIKQHIEEFQDRNVTILDDLNNL
jgi:hypothetical protein